jgi:hypothetical protein
MCKSEVKLVLMMIMLIALSLSGCLGCNLKNIGLSVTPPMTPSPLALPSATEPVPVPPEAVATVVPTSHSPGLVVITTEKGYTIRSSPEAGDATPVELKAGKTSFRIKLANYPVGDTYTMVLTSINEPFSYKSTHEFTGNGGTGDIQITKNIPVEGRYQIKLDYPDDWEVEISQ